MNMTRQLSICVQQPSATLQKTNRYYHYMTQAQRDMRRKKLKRRQELKRRYFCLFVLLAVIFIFGISNQMFRSDALMMNEKKIERSYRSVMVKSGDTLWTIAKEQTEFFPEIHVDSYIKDIKKINGLKSDTIHYGNYIIIPILSYVESSDF